jgi:hypothetical protein
LAALASAFRGSHSNTYSVYTECRGAPNLFAQHGDGRSAALVPEISRSLGVRDRHVPSRARRASLHAVYGEHKITVEIESGTVRGTFPTRALRLVLEWARVHKSELLANWERARQRDLTRVACRARAAMIEGLR